jgi:hypothetical protein
MLRSPGSTCGTSIDGDVSRISCGITSGARHTGRDQPEPEPVPGTGPTGTLVLPITDEGVAFDSDTATGMMPTAQRVVGVLSSWRS